MKAEDLGKVRKAMKHPDLHVLKIKYVAKDLQVTERIVSPIRFEDGDKLRCLCLGRDDTRTFLVDGIASIELVDANSVMIPEPIKGDHET